MTASKLFFTFSTVLWNFNSTSNACVICYIFARYGFIFRWILINAESKENDALHKICECYTWIDQIKISVKQDCFGNTSICDSGLVHFTEKGMRSYFWFDACCFAQICLRIINIRLFKMFIYIVNL